ncbi:MAG: hypothetical protein QM811_08275 [Pirellulales bacterium]
MLRVPSFIKADMELANSGGFGASRRFRAALWVASFVATCVAMTWILAVDAARHSEFAFNSDLLHPYIFMQDVLRKPSEFQSWDLSRTPYVFPDWILAAVLDVSPLPHMWRPIVYGGVLMTIQAYCVAWMLREMRTLGSVASVMWGVLTIASTFILDGRTHMGEGRTFFLYTVTAFIHSGALMSGLAFIPLLSKIVHADDLARKRPLIVAGIVTAIATYSDYLFVLWFAIPAGVAFFIIATPMPRRRKFTMFAALGGVAVVVTLLDMAVRRDFKRFDLDHLKSIEVWSDLLIYAYRNKQWQIWLSAAIGVVMMGRGVLLTFTPRDPMSARRDGIELALIYCNTTAMALPLVTGVLTYTGNFCYALPMLTLPYVWVSCCASRGLSARFERYAVIFGAVVWLVLATQNHKGRHALTKLREPQSISRYLPELGLRTGFGDYWTCKRTLYETDYAVHMIPLDASGKQSDFAYNRSWFERRADDGTAVEPTFVVLTRLDEEKIRARFGDPSRILTLGSDVVWIYDRPIPIEKSLPPRD